jgi:hypothetical protein
VTQLGQFPVAKAGSRTDEFRPARPDPVLGTPSHVILVQKSEIPCRIDYSRKALPGMVASMGIPPRASRTRRVIGQHDPPARDALSLSDCHHARSHTRENIVLAPVRVLTADNDWSGSVWRVTQGEAEV